MQFLIISIVCSVAVSVLLKVARQRGIVLEQAIAWNYAVASALCFWVLQPDVRSLQGQTALWPLFLALGVLLPGVFVIMARAVEAAGIVRSDAAQRLSLFIPIVAAFVLFGEVLNHNRLIGLVLAFAALLCLLVKADTGKGKASGGPVRTAMLLAGVWLGYGVIDVLFKQTAKAGSAFAPVLLLSLILAGVLMFACLLLQKSRFTAASVLGGLVLGCLNFANILFYIRAHQAYASNPTLVFAGMNIGVIGLGTLVGAAVFKERLSVVNVMGLVLAVLAIAVLFYLDALRRLVGW